MDAMAAVDVLGAARAESRKRLRLTDRWTDLKAHAEQSRYFWHPARFKIVPPGRRSGKTENAKRRGVLMLVRKRRWPARVLFAAPTHDQARRIFWQDLQDLIPPWWVARKREADMEIWTHWGAMVKVMGLQQPQRVEGVPWDHMFVDEVADCPPGCFALNLRPALSTLGREGGCDLLGVPDEVGRNQAEYEQLFQAGLLWPHKDPDVCSFHWKSSEVLPAKEIAAARRSLSRQQFEQEYEGQFVRSNGKACPDFVEREHCRAEYCQFDPTLPLDWCLDFGVNPAASLICQTRHLPGYGPRSYVLDEIVLKASSTAFAAEQFLQRRADRGWDDVPVRVYGDAAGRQHHSPVGESDYEILEQKLKGLPSVEWCQLACNPLVKDSLNAVRSALCNADHQVRLHVHPERCPTLLKDLCDAPWPDDLRAFHALAGLRYYLFGLANANAAITVGGIEQGHPGYGGRAARD